MNGREARALAFALALLASGCAATGGQAATRATPGEVAFIDLDTFDQALAEDFRGRLDAVTVRFPNQSTTINEMPPRLQKWLSAVQRRGGGVSVTTRDGYAPKDVALAVSVLLAGYRFLRDNVPSVLGRRYRAVITLENGDGLIERVDFVRL